MFRELPELPISSKAFNDRNQNQARTQSRLDLGSEEGYCTAVFSDVDTINLLKRSHPLTNLPIHILGYGTGYLTMFRFLLHKSPQALLLLPEAIMTI